MADLVHLKTARTINLLINKPEKKTYTHCAGTCQLLTFHAPGRLAESLFSSACTRLRRNMQARGYRMCRRCTAGATGASSNASSKSSSSSTAGARAWPGATGLPTGAERRASRSSRSLSIAAPGVGVDFIGGAGATAGLWTTGLVVAVDVTAGVAVALVVAGKETAAD